MSKNKYDWEVPEIDLNLRNKKYKGKPSEAIKQLKDDIVNYLKKDNIPLKHQQIYSAIYNALNYYSLVTYSPSAEYDIEDTFLTYAINELNNDYIFMQKYNEMYPDDAPLIDMSARIKSPISYLTKVKETVDNYLKNGKDLTYLNIGLKDLLGAQIIVNVPKSIKEKGKDAESDFLYKVYIDFLKHHGIYETENNLSSPGSIHHYKFLTVNDIITPDRLQKIESRANREGYNQESLKKIHIPNSRPPEMESETIKNVTRDYVKFPKKSCYQSLHVYATPYYSKEIQHYDLPNEIIPPQDTDCTMEYHFYLRDHYNFQAFGDASHINSYKPHEKTYHRLAVPTFIDFDRDENIITNNNDDSTAQHKLGNRLRIRNFAECLYKFYHISFKDLFNIPFLTFRDTFKPSTRDDILALEKKVIKTPDNSWTAIPYKKPIVATIEELKSVKDVIEKFINFDKTTTEKKAVKHIINGRPSPFVIVKNARPKNYLHHLISNGTNYPPSFDEEDPIK